ncbi:MAG: GNAT family N-acetyltransferase [Nanoarchaeota archaeon]|nr:GNAT family N-acetyltransferase [Nanoarchaeota archaeon]
MKYKSSKLLNKKDLKELLLSEGIGKSEKELKSIQDSFRNSNAVFSVWDGKKLVGIIRGLTDGISRGLALDLFVHKKYRNKGLGEKLLFKIFRKYPSLKWHLKSSKMARGFYKRLKLIKDEELWFTYKRGR